MATTIPNIKNPVEYETYRNENGIVTTAGSLNFSNTYGQESISVSSMHGNDLTFASQATSLFNPNNFQIKTNGDNFETTEGNKATHVGGDHYTNVVGSYTITSGIPELFDDEQTLTSNYIKLKAQIAAAAVQPPVLMGGHTNNSKSTVEMKGGSPDKTSGSTDGQAFSENPAFKDYTKFVESKIPQATKLENQMGIGGNLIFSSGKHVLLTAGTKAAAFDSGYINPVGRQIQKGSELKNNKVVPKYAGVPTYQEVDTFSDMPWGNVDILGSTRVSMGAGAGGVEIKSAGSMKFYGTGLTWIGGSQVDLKSTGAVYIDGKHIETVADSLNVDCDESTFNGNVSVIQDVIISGNLVVGGNITVLGDIKCLGTITADVDVIGAGVSLKSHTHGGVQGGNSNTAKPN